MAEYIEREAALEMLNKSLSFCENELDLGAYRTGCIAAIQDDIGNIKHIPTADVVEVRHGEWLEWEDEMLGVVYMCSVCKEDFVTVEGTPSDNLWYYCPHCGAKMDGKGEN